MLAVGIGIIAIEFQPELMLRLEYASELWLLAGALIAAGPLVLSKRPIVGAIVWGIVGLGTAQLAGEIIAANPERFQ